MKKILLIALLVCNFKNVLSQELVENNPNQDVQNNKKQETTTNLNNSKKRNNNGGVIIASVVISTLIASVFPTICYLNLKNNQKELQDIKEKLNQLSDKDIKEIKEKLEQVLSKKLEESQPAKVANAGEGSNLSRVLGGISPQDLLAMAMQYFARNAEEKK